MSSCGTYATHIAVLGVKITCSICYDRADDSSIHRGLLQCVAVDAVCCSVSKFDAVYYTVIQCEEVSCDLIAAACSSVLQCAAVCCSMLQCVAVRCSALQCVAV